MSNEITLLHFSDLHFGEGHRFNTDIIDVKNMAASINEDIERHTLQSNPIMVAITGDFINAKDKDNIIRNFDIAFDFLHSICTKTSTDEIDSQNIFIVPGNHDVIHQEPDNNFDNYYKFYEKIHGKKPNLIEIRKYENPQIIIAEINSCSFVKDDPKGLRGRVTESAIKKMQEDLEKIKINFQYNDYLKIALLHHHIVLLPPFIKKRQGKTRNNDEIINDTIMNNNHLISVLNKYNFHLILHGHKHHPCQYIHDPNSYWDKNSSKIPMLIVAAGSCGSKQLPSSGEQPCNTFNVLQINWENRGQITIKLAVKGLQIYDEEKEELPQNEWYWESIKYREFCFQYLQTNKCEWKITISNEVLNTSEALISCLKNCLLDDSIFLKTVYSEQDYRNSKPTIYNISTLKYKYIDSVLDAIKDQIQKIDLEEVCKIQDGYDISEKTEKNIINNAKLAGARIENFIRKYQNGNKS